MADVVLELTDTTFDETIKGDKPVLVDFWAPWCGPCRAVAPIVHALAVENAGNIVVGKVNVDESQQVASKFGITSIPTLMIFKNGQMVERVVGAQSKAALQSLIDSVR